MKVLKLSSNSLKRSFTLIELSVVIVLMGIMLSFSIVGGNAIMKNIQKSKNKQKIQVIKNALQNYFDINGRLPKPADYTIEFSNQNYGHEKTTKSSYDVSIDSDIYGAIVDNYHDLPGEYQEVEYIQSTGIQAIDTGIKPTSETKLEFKINFQSAGHFVAYNSATQNRFGFYFTGSNMRYDYSSGCTTTTCRTISDYSMAYNQDYEITIYKGITINGFTFAENTTTFSVGTNFYLFAMNNGGLNWITKAKLYYWKMYENGVITRHFIPCYRKSDNVVGMYDIIGQKFYTNVGSGSFLTGGEIKTNINYVIFKGIVPFKELKLTENDIIDEYGNYIEYYVPEIMTISNETTIKDLSNKDITKTGYTIKSKMLPYENYVCPAKKNGLPSTICDGGRVSSYAVEFQQLSNKDSGLPTEYRQLRNIELLGGNHQIDLKHTVTNSTKVRFKYTYTTCNGAAFIGANLGSDSTDWRFFCASDGNTYFDAGDNAYRLYISGYIKNGGTELHETEIGKYYIKDMFSNTILISSTSNAYTTGINIVMQNNTEYGNIYYIKIYEGYTLKKHFIPCYNVSNNYIGLYDIIGKSFYTNSNGIYFNKGDEYVNKAIFEIMPYGMRIKNTQTNQFIDDNGTIAYTLVSHGKNGSKTCSIRKTSKNATKLTLITTLTSNNATATTKFEAQNCLNATENTTLGIIGRNKFMTAKNQELTFYQGIANADFDDIVNFTTINDLILHGRKIEGF